MVRAIVGNALARDWAEPLRGSANARGPSVVFDVVAIVLSTSGAAQFASDAQVKDFVTDAFAHSRFIAQAPSAAELVSAAGISDRLDEGSIPVEDATDANEFLDACNRLRHWSREPHVNPL